MIKNRFFKLFLSVLGLFIFSFALYHGINEYFSAKKINIFRLSISFVMILVLLVTTYNLILNKKR